MPLHRYFTGPCQWTLTNMPLHCICFGTKRHSALPYFMPKLPNRKGGEGHRKKTCTQLDGLTTSQRNEGTLIVCTAGDIICIGYPQ